MSIHPDPEPPETSAPLHWSVPGWRDSRPVDDPDPAPLDLSAVVAEMLTVDLTRAAPSVRLELLGKLGAVDAAVHAWRLATIASLSPVVEDGYWAEQHVVEELRLAMGVGSGCAGDLLDQARAVFGGEPRGAELTYLDDDGDADGDDVGDGVDGAEDAGSGEASPGDDLSGVAGQVDQPEPAGPVVPFAVMGALLRAGLSSPAHLHALAQITANVADDPAPDPAGAEAPSARPWRSREDKLAEIACRSRRSAARAGLVSYRKTVRRNLARVDGDEQTGRRAVADAKRHVALYQREDGQAVLAAEGPALRTRQMQVALNEHAELLRTARGGVAAARRGVIEARISVCRYDAMHALITGSPAGYPRPDDTSGCLAEPDTSAGAVDQDVPAGVDDPVEVLPGMPTAPTVELGPQVRPRLEGMLVIDVRTLAGLAEHPGLLDGEPIPAAMARALALDTVSWRRLVTDPLTGHLLDYGTRQYTPDPLWRWVKMRDGGCTAPDCNHGLYRAEVDHRNPWPQGGSDRDNTGVLCTIGSHHQLKTGGWITITDSHADGSMTWRTAWGQSIRTSPSAHLPGFDEWAEHDDGLPPEPKPAPPPTPKSAPDPNEEPPF